MFKWFREARWNHIRKQVLERDRYTCQYCGSIDDLSVDHIWPRSKGGTDNLSNLVTACKACNSSKSGKTLREWMGSKSDLPQPAPIIRLVTYRADLVESSIDLGIPYPEKWKPFAEIMMSEKGTHRSFVGMGKLFSRREYDNFIGAFIEAGLMKWRNEESHNRGTVLTPQGWEVVRAMAGEESEYAGLPLMEENGVLVDETPEEELLEQDEESLETTTPEAENQKVIRDPLYDKAVEAVLGSGRASASYLQILFSIGYTRATRLMTQLEANGVVGAIGSAGQQRKILIDNSPVTTEGE